MSNENSNKPVDRNPIRRRIHPIWRGIGFLMIILIPIMGYATATMVMDENHKQNWFPIPKQILGPSNDPELYMRLITRGGYSLKITFSVPVWSNRRSTG
jgi:hypothetical protein